MERVQGPLPKQTSASAHLLSCFSSSSSPPSELSPPFPPPLHPTSQALFWNISGTHSPHNLIHQASPWSPLCPDIHMPPPAPDLSNVLQLTHGAAVRAAPDGAGANNATPNRVAKIDALVTPSDSAVGPALLVENCVNLEKSQSLTYSSGCAPFGCKLDMCAHKSRGTLLASLSAHIAEDTDGFSVAEHNGPASTSMGDNSIFGFQGDGKLYQNRAEQSSIEEGRYEWVEKQAEKDLPKQTEGAGGGAVHNLGDAAIGLKLGKRTYFGDSRVGGAVEASKQVPNSATPNNSGGSIASSSSGGSAKKWKAATPAANVPRCQAEDCKIDLTGAKEYHRRHKVCEWHSKSSKVKVANLEQRFCQQCSRFHVLTEFDEGKRSCRRRLAGHNERRRKQHPEPFPLLSAASYAYFAGAKQLFNPSLLDCPHFFEHKHAAADLKELQKPKIEPVENYQPLELHHFMQASQRGGNEHLLLGGSAAQALVVAGGNGTNLGSLSTPLATLTSCLIPDHPPQPSPETLVSGRALSLLSSSLGFPNTSNYVSTALGVSLPSFERQRILENHQGMSSHQIIARASSCFTPNAFKPLETLPLSHNNTESGAFSHCLSVNEIQPSTILSFAHSTAFPISHAHDGQSGGAARPMLDLMEVPFVQSGTPRHQVEHQFTTDLEGLSIFGRQSLM